jgi:tetratricopeptide (TPR) repeat protein
MNTSNTSLLPNSATVSPWPMKVKLGPHQDLLATCDFSSDEENDSVGTLLQTALSSDSAQERVAAARKAIELSNGACGLAWLVLAREGVNSIESAMIYSQRAIDRMKQELHDSNFKDYCIYTYTYTVALADAADITFKLGRKRDAVEMLKQQLAAGVEDALWSDCQIILRDQIASLLIQMGEAKEAQTFLYAHPDNIESWYYLNALAHFALNGDSLISRSALAKAFKVGVKTVQKLTADASVFSAQSEHFEQNICIEKAVDAWQNDEAAQEWLKQIYKNPHSVIGRESLAVASANKDKKRWQLWDSRETSAAYFMSNEMYKEAAKEFKAALREAERINYSYFPFHNTVTGLLALYQEADVKAIPLEELRQKLEARVANFGENSGNSPAGAISKNDLAALNFHSFATIYKELGDFEAAMNNQVKALEIAETLEHEEQLDRASALTLFEIGEINKAQAEILFEQNRYQDALKYCKKALTKQEQFLGATHYDLLDSLELAQECCQQLGDLAGKAAMTSRIKTIDPFDLG